MNLTEPKSLLIFVVSLITLFGGLIMMCLKPFPLIVSPINIVGALFFILGMATLTYFSYSIEIK